MILSNVKILEAISSGNLKIDPPPPNDPTQAPFNTSAIDLHLGEELIIPELTAPICIDLSQPLQISKLLQAHSRKIAITQEQPFHLEPNKFILATTKERVAFPINGQGPYYAARVEGKSSRARCGLLIHFTAPTIHSGFEGNITLEIINLGPFKFSLAPGMAICQLIIEEIFGQPVDAPNQFTGQTSPIGKL